MAQRRMFSKTITSSSQFLMMPQSSQNLYFHLGMNADDDGFCEHFAIMRMTDSKPDDLKVLSGKGFVNVFDERVLVILDWKENNYLRSDRYTPSKYLEVYKQEIALISQNKDNVYKMDTTGIPNVHQMDTQVRVGKGRIGKDRKGEVSITSEQSSQVNELMGIFYKINPGLNFGNKTQRGAMEWMIEKWGIEKAKNTVKFACSVQGQQYAPTITSPVQLKNKIGDLTTFFKKQNSNSELPKAVRI